MDVDEILDDYNLDRQIAAKYIDAITQMNQTQTAETIEVSRQTVNRYKNAFQEMTDTQRLLLISSLAQDQLLEKSVNQK